MVQTSQGKRLLGLGAQNLHNLPAIGDRALAQLADQRALAYAGLPGDHDRRLGVFSQYPAQLRTLSCANDQTLTGAHPLTLPESATYE